MTADQPLSREQQLQKLESFCRALNGLFARAGLTPEQSEEVWRLGVAAECSRCGIRIYGEELYALSQPPSEKWANAKIGRLRLGNCARDGCDAYSYRLTFYPYGDLDWPAILASVDGTKEEPAPQAAGQSTRRMGWGLVWQSSAARRVGLGLGAIVLLLLVRQWYIGGRIPLLREPQIFQADPACMQPATPEPGFQGTTNGLRPVSL